MRIRKHASKILGIASSFPSSSPPPSQLPPAYVCELNRSPWDLVPLPPLPHSDDEYWSPDPKEQQDEGLLGNGIKGEEAMSVTASTELMRNEEEKSTNVKKGKKRNKKKMKKEVGIEANNAAATTVSTCKKTDGKQWQCKRPAHHPHTFCHYHLTQLRSYSYSSGHNKISSAGGNHGTTRRKRAVMDSVGSDSNYVYYSTFGPWRAKRRGGDRSGIAVAAKHEQVGEEEEKGDSNSAPMVHDDQKNSDEEDVGVEDSEGKKKMEMDRRDPSRNKPKKRRKPVKERSLKSLL